jgi:PAS domain S-box-containing protein
MHPSAHDAAAPTARPLQERLTSMLGAVDVGLWYCDLPFDVLEWDRKVKEHFWIPADERVTIERFYERLHPDDRERTRRAIAEAIASRTPYDIEYRTVAPPGTPSAGRERWLRAIGYTAYDEAGRPTRFDGVTVDISAQKRTAQALAESEARFRNMADSAPVMIWVTDPAGCCVYLNQQWYDFTGQTPASGLGYGWLDAVHPDDRDRAGQIFVDSNARHAPFRADYRLRRHDGAYRHCVDSAAPRFAADGSYGGYVGSVVDIHERTEAAAERGRLLDAERAARADAEAANRAKSEFLAVMSHELRTPLNAIGGYAQLIEMGLRGPVTELQRADLERIRRSQEHLLGLINGVLNYARLEAGRVEYSLGRVPVSGLLGAVESLVTPQLADRGLELVVAPVDDDLGVHADPEKALQVLLNLASNAMKFTPAGGRVTLEAAPVPADAAGRPRVEVRVRDTGVGVPTERRAEIFDPFVQVDARLTRTEQGVGLGLAISRDLARGMGGDLTMDEAPGGGSVFSLVLERAG